MSAQRSDLIHGEAELDGDENDDSMDEETGEAQSDKQGLNADLDDSSEEDEEDDEEEAAAVCPRATQTERSRIC